MVLEMDDLIDWAVDNYKSLMVDQLEKILHGKEDATAGVGDIKSDCLLLRGF